MTSTESPAPAAHQPVDGQPMGGSALLGVLTVAARALAASPADADDAALLAILGQVIVPSLGDVVALYAPDGSGTLRLIASAPGTEPPTRRLGEQAGDQPVIVAPLDGDMSGGDLLVIVATDAARRYDAADRSAAEVLAALVGARRLARQHAEREAAQGQQVETIAMAGRELAHTLNNDLTMPVGVIELLLDRTSFTPDLHEMLEAAAKDLAAVEQHVRAFHTLMRAQIGGTTAD